MEELKLLFDEFKELLTEQENERFTNLCVYIRGGFYSKKIQDKLILDIGVMIRDGKLNEQTLDQIIGSDDRKFVDEIFKNCGYKKSYKEIIFGVLQGVAVLFFIKFLFSITVCIYKNSFMVNVTLGEILALIFIIIFSVFYIQYICKNAFNKKISKISFFVCFTGNLFLFLFLLLRNVVFVAPIYVFPLISIILFLFVKIKDR